jgi:hypothetical protein
MASIPTDRAPRHLQVMEGRRIIADTTSLENPRLGAFTGR